MRSHADECERGELSSIACKVLMKDLWAARLARPDIQKPICDLATKVQCWSRNDDKRLHRLMCYMNSSQFFTLTGKVNDAPELLKLPELHKPPEPPEPHVSNLSLDFRVFESSFREVCLTALRRFLILSWTFSDKIPYRSASNPF